MTIFFFKSIYSFIPKFQTLLRMQNHVFYDQNSYPQFFKDKEYLRLKILNSKFVLDHQEVPGGPEGSCSALRRHAAHASVRREIVFLPQDIQVG